MTGAGRASLVADLKRERETGATSEGPTDTRASGDGAIWAALGAFFLWGVLPVYWKQFHGVSAWEVIAHRVVWSLAVLWMVLPLRGRMGQYLGALRSVRSTAIYFASGALLSANWLTFVYAVERDRIVEASLGYFLNPLFSVALGALVLGERLRPAQWLAVGLATLGVGVQVVALGSLPWVSLALAGTFALYGLLRKQGPLGALTGLAVETTLMAPAALVFMIWMHGKGAGVFALAGWEERAWAVSTGVVTTAPLLLFATAARRLPLSTIGVCQYVAPSLQLAVGVALYGEPFGGARVAAFACIWAGLAVFTADGYRRSRR
ncbi:EamA family transporter RarD [Opitutales bacterium ASA1]|nr:EamA family transporter RarD [Opitutales bacterium ASA1]